jgi:hypothetical protein
LTAGAVGSASVARERFAGTFRLVSGRIVRVTVHSDADEASAAAERLAEELG